MDDKETLERMHHQKLYYCHNEELLARQEQCLDRLYDFNQTRPTEFQKRTELLKEMFAEIGEGCYIEPPLRANWGGHHVHFGNGVYANFNLTLVDDTHIYVGNHVMFGPNVTLATASHPIHPELRIKQAQFNRPIIIGNNVWIGAGAVSIVTKDIPDHVVAVGNPCKVLRAINERDYEYYFKEMKIDID